MSWIKQSKKCFAFEMYYELCTHKAFHLHNDIFWYNLTMGSTKGFLSAPLLTRAGANPKFKAHSGWWTLARVKATEVSKCPSWLHTSHLITGHLNNSCPITLHLFWLRNWEQVTTGPTMLKQSKGSVLYSIQNESLTVLCFILSSWCCCCCLSDIIMLGKT